MSVSEFVTKLIGEKGQWREYKARVQKLPASYRTAVEALERYLMYFGGGGDGTAIFVDLVELFEQSAASRTPVRQIVGEDPVEFIENFINNYPKGDWVVRERERLNTAIAQAAQEEASPQSA